MKNSITFKVVFEKDKWPDESEKEAIWRAHIPILPGAHAWGNTKEETLENLKNAAELVLEDLQDQKKAIPEEPCSEIVSSDETLITV